MHDKIVTLVNFEFVNFVFFLAPEGKRKYIKKVQLATCITKKSTKQNKAKTVLSLVLKMEETCT